LTECQIVVATEVRCPETAESFACAPITTAEPYAAGPLLSQNCIANDAAQKKALSTAGAIAVDMEASGVAARAQRAGLPFACIKVVSDRADESFPFDLNRMRTPEGRIARGKIVLH